jgi:hypothetical protein
MATIKRTLYFILPVEFRAETLKGLKEAIRSYRQDPSFGCSGAGEHGFYGWTQKKQVLTKSELKKAAPSRRR